MSDINTTHHTLGCWTAGDIVIERVSGVLMLIHRGLEMVMDVNSGYFQHPVYRCYITGDCRQISIHEGADFLFGQNSGQGTHHSAADGTNDVIQRGCMFFLGIDTIKFLYTAVNTVVHGFVIPFDFSLSRRSLFPRYCYM